ncbi:MAG: hemerythrin domain-containing protein [Peptoniphilus rhinitidis]|uniref:hemerythrin domain-containing protein n=1 Tax=Peptoniphilus rhinitidis TaxID=1175452 RepID=UPI0028FE22D0|nr:hemerythrin domain-containing protein [Peptoniphilus rhinitidis]MDU2109968.1 hemerythrin domain-containing protein [Peptoniphilus lacydonensis]MDU3750433.1 hemerythrin domain-containing protein [Peptoniphilus rhinitidis]
MLDKNMTVEAAVMENPKVLKEIQKLGAEYDFIAMESLEDALKSLGTNYEDFLKKVQDQVEFKDMDRVYKMNKEELINYIVNEIHPYELEMTEKIDEIFRGAIKKYYRERGEQLFVIYEVILLIKAELISHFSSEEEFEFKDALAGKDVNFENLIAEHEKTIGLFDRVKYLTRDYKMNAEEPEVKELNSLMEELDKDIRRHIYIENEILFKM